MKVGGLAGAVAGMNGDGCEGEGVRGVWKDNAVLDFGCLELVRWLLCMGRINGLCFSVWGSTSLAGVFVAALFATRVIIDRHNCSGSRLACRPTNLLRHQFSYCHPGLSSSSPRRIEVIACVCRPGHLKDPHHRGTWLILYSYL